MQTNLKNCELVSPCKNAKKEICPKRNYPVCVTTCEPMQAFKAQLRYEECFMGSSSCEHGPDYPIHFQNDGVAYR
jgi:hypothetical protein